MQSALARGQFTRKLATLLPAALALALLGPSVAWAIPTIVTAEGLLTSSGGGPAADGTYDITFGIFPVASGGTAAWQEGPVQVVVKGGQFTWLLGSKTPLAAGAIKLPDAWLSVKIGADPELARRPLGSSLYALRAAVAEALDCSGCVAVGALDPNILKDYAKVSDLSGLAKSADLAAYAKTVDLAAYAKASDLSGYAKTTDLAGLAKTTDLGAYAKSSDLQDYVKAAALAKVAGTGNYADLTGAPTLAKVASTGEYKDLANAPAVPAVGKPCGTGLFAKGFNADGSLNCAALAQGDLPGNGIDEVSNGLINNQFVDSTAGTKNVAIPDGLGAGTSDALTFPDIGLAEKLWIEVNLTNSDVSKLKIEAYAPGNPSVYVLYDGGKSGTTLSAKFNLDTPLVSGDLDKDWLGQNIKGQWSITVKDPLKNQAGATDGAYSWSVNIQTLSSKKILVKGNVIAQGSVQIGPDDSTCGTGNAGAIRWNGKAFQGCNGTAWVGLQGNDGSSQAAAGKDCKAIKAAVPSVADGIYWIDPNGGTTADAFQAYCDMTTDGGGWTFFAHVNNNYVGATLFQANTGTYRADRADDNTTYSKAADILPLLSHTQMMVTLDMADAVSAKNASKIVFFQYTAGHSGFNAGPVPCSGLGGFAYRTELSGAFTSGGTSNSCDGTSWYTRTAGNAAYLVMFNNGTGYANYWGTGMGGNNTWYHDGFWYVR